MMRGTKPQPSALRRRNGNPGKRGYNHAEPQPPSEMPNCPPHLSPVARDEWARLAQVLFDIGVLALTDRAALAAYCQAYGRWVEAEERLAETPMLIKAPSGYVQQSPWLSVANKQLELMGRFMAELGLTPAARSRIRSFDAPMQDPVTEVKFTVVYEDANGNKVEEPMPSAGTALPKSTGRKTPNTIVIDKDDMQL